MLQEGANALVRLLLAPSCVSCRGRLARPLTGPVCESCWAGVLSPTPPLCDRCGDQVPSSGTSLCARCRQSPPHFALARSAGLYEGPLREMIHAFKYERRRVLATPLARMMARSGAAVLEGADAIVPVPLHLWRALHRGFNQADDLARQLNLPVWRVLRRERGGPAQVSLPEHRRHANVRGAFALRRFTVAPRPSRAATRLAGATVVLVDDVMTTGATLDACSQVLLASGVRSVRALTVARAVATAPSSRQPSRRPSTVPRR
jgi:ComF family protein